MEEKTLFEVDFPTMDTSSNDRTITEASEGVSGSEKVN